MALLLDLSNEILLEIIVYVQHSSPNQIRTLSRVCKRLNACCGPWIFQKYNLCLRTRRCKVLTNLDTTETLKSWSLDAVMARISHFRDKAPYVKDLILEDRRNGEQNDNTEPEHFPECIIPDLLDALRGASRVVNINVTCGYGGTIPLALWEWITTKDLMTLKIGNLLAPPPNAMMHPKVQSFEGGLFKESMPFLDLIRPESIKLRYPQFYEKEPEIGSYKPSCPHNANLRKIVLEVDLPRKFEKSLLDFSGVPEATIRATFYLGVEYKMHVPDAWVRLKAKLPTVFAESLNNYDVARPFRTDVFVTRPSLAEITAGWKPKNAVHLEGEAEEHEERQQMQEYYQYRARQQMNDFLRQQ